MGAVEFPDAVKTGPSLLLFWFLPQVALGVIVGRWWAGLVPLGVCVTLALLAECGSGFGCEFNYRAALLALGVTGALTAWIGVLIRRMLASRSRASGS